MSNISIFTIMLFVATTLLTVWMFYKASDKSKPILFGVLAWMLLQAILALNGFYQAPNSVPPRFIMLIAPGLLFSILLLVTKWGNKFIDNLDLKILTLMHTIRIPVEITLYFIYTAGLIPVLMTFEGNNYDIISGLTAPIIFYFVFIIKKLNWTSLLTWNFISLGLLIIVLIIAVLSAQTPFQKLAFNKPNIGVTYFPFIWLPSVVVPIVFVGHLSAIRQLLKKKSINFKN